MLRDGTAGPTRRRRVASIDLLRGLIMIVMSLDHVRDFTNRQAMAGNPLDLSTTTEAMFMTRWVTHICAPAFALTAGIGAWLWWSKGRTRRELSSFLLTRGLWLTALELGVMQFAYYFAWPKDVPVLLLVLWSLGLSMVAMAGLAWLPRNALFALSLAAILLHPLLDPISAEGFGRLAGVWNVLHQVGAFPVGGSVVVIPYPLIPWVGVMCLGFCLGPLFSGERERSGVLMLVGTALAAAFLMIRGLNGYGDPFPWAAGRDPVWTVLSFLNVSKYPASPDFLLMTLGLAFLLLGLLERRSGPARTEKILLTFGRVPLFFYILHFFIAHALATMIWFAMYGFSAANFAFLPYPSFGGDGGRFPTGFGVPLWSTFCVWLAVLVIVYPLCRWFRRIKESRSAWWLSYL